MDDEPARPRRRLMEIALEVSSLAMDAALPIYEGRASKEPHWFDTWPGEHYRLLAALMRSLNPKTVIEIRTFTGMGTLALAQELQPSGTLTTFDLLAWDSFADTWLAPSDFAAGRERQVLHDISAPGGIASHRALFESADLIFVDGPKDGITEANILANLATLNLSREVVVVFDDIRVVNMIDIWRRNGRPKMDLTSFGHWSGTGLVDWNGTSCL
jgi:predicted O-methyltransferase YrrM